MRSRPPRDSLDGALDKKSRLTPHRLTLPSPWFAILLAANLSLSAAPIDESKLPPPANVQVDYLRDIKPIFEGHCLKCHGPVKPKSGFRVDNREDLLKGGDNGTNVFAGQSSKSPLIHYAAYLVEDMEMPPAGKGERLTPDQVGLLRAWIDQGVSWAETPAPPRLQFSVSPAFRWFSVDGNERKFREHRWFREDARGGVAEFSVREQLDPKTRQIIEGHALDSDYRAVLTLERTDLGFVRAGWQQYTRYFDDTGGFFEPFTPSAFRLDRNLSLDLGKFWAEAGLQRPGWPEVLLGYEYHYKDGNKSITQWLPETQTVGAAAVVRSIYPNAKQIDERTHIIRLDLDHNLAGTRITDNFRYEFHDSQTRRPGILESAIARDPIVLVNEGYEHQQWANALRFERPFRDWLFASAGYLYVGHDGEASIRMNAVDAAGAPAAGYYWQADAIMLDQSSHTANANVQLGPWKHLVFAGGVQTEWAHQEGLGSVALDLGEDADPTTFVPAVVSANHDRLSAEENVLLRFTGVPRTVLFFESRLRQEEIGQFERQQGGVGQEFARATDADNQSQEYRGGFQLSPWQRVALSAHYRRRYRDSEYDHDRDFGASSNGYSAFILSRDTTLDEIEAKVTWHPLTWLKTTLTYKVAATDYRTETEDAIVFPARLAPPGGRILAGNHDAHILSFNATMSPFARLYLSTTFSWQDSRISTPGEGTNSPSVAPYQGQIYSVISSANYVWNEKTELQSSYSFSCADYGQNNEVNGLPLGLTYQSHGLQAGISRQLRKNVRLNLQYGWYYYDEPTSGHLADYTAHGVFAVVNVRWP